MDVVRVPQCKAKSKRSGERCKRHAARGYSVCYMHGANAKSRGGGKPGNKAARTHGGYESLIFSTLDDDERAAWDSVPTEITDQIEHEIKLVSFREYRLMRRIAELAGQDMVAVQKTYANGIDRNAETDLTTTVSEAALPLILKAEEALTRAQAQKARLIDLKHKLSEQSDSKGAKAILGLVDAMRDRWSQNADSDGENDIIGGQ